MKIKILANHFGHRKYSFGLSAIPAMQARAGMEKHALSTPPHVCQPPLLLRLLHMNRTSTRRPACTQILRRAETQMRRRHHLHQSLPELWRRLAMMQLCRTRSRRAWIHLRLHMLTRPLQVQLLIRLWLSLIRSQINCDPTTQQIGALLGTLTRLCLLAATMVFCRLSLLIRLSRLVAETRSATCKNASNLILS